jgi:hypothetical protein
MFPKKNEIKPGDHCVITQVWHPVLNYLLGRRVVIAKVNMESGMAWVHDDKPAEVRINRLGNKELRNQKCIQTLIGLSNITKSSELYSPVCASNLVELGDKSQWERKYCDGE